MTRAAGFSQMSDAVMSNWMVTEADLLAQGTPLPIDEFSRLRSLQSYPIPSGEVARQLEELTFLACQATALPFAAVSFVLDREVLLVARQGVDWEQRPRPHWFCSYAILQRELFLIQNASTDPRFNPIPENPPAEVDLATEPVGAAATRSNRAVFPKMALLSYAGTPLRNPQGFALGTLWVGDNQPLTWSELKTRALMFLAQQVQQVLETIRQTETDLPVNSKPAVVFESAPVHPSDKSPPGPDNTALVKPKFPHPLKLGDPVSASLVHSQFSPVQATPAPVQAEATGGAADRPDLSQSSVSQNAASSSAETIIAGPGLEETVIEGPAIELPVSDESSPLPQAKDLTQLKVLPHLLEHSEAMGQDTIALASDSLVTPVLEGGRPSNALSPPHSTTMKASLAELILSQIRDGLLVTTARWYLPAGPKIVYVNPSLVRMSGFRSADLVGHDLGLLWHIENDEGERGWRNIYKRFLEGRSFSGESVFRRKDGSTYDVNWYLSPLRDPRDGHIRYWISGMRDVTERNIANRRLRLLESAVRHANDGIILLELAPGAQSAWEACIEYANEGFARMTGYSPEEVLHKPWQICRGAATDPHEAQRIWRAMQQRQSIQAELQMVTAHGNHFWVELNLVPLTEEESGLTHWVLIQRDVSARKQAEQRLTFHAYHDALTQLPNRAMLMRRLRELLESAHHGRQRSFAVFFMDLDRFKFVNDSMGHEIGDQLLIEIASRLQNSLRRQDDLVARLGGDEFVVLSENIEGEAEALALAERLQEALLAPLRLEDVETFTTVSIGIVLSSGEHQTPDDVLRDADTAMYQAKRMGPGKRAIFRKDMHLEVKRLFTLDKDLRRALDRDEFVVFYQPIYALRPKQIIGFEALVRWRHPDHGLIGPAEFIGLAEETGLIVPLGERVFQLACEQFQRWRHEFAPFLPTTTSSTTTASTTSRLADHDPENGAATPLDSVTETVASDRIGQLQLSVNLSPTQIAHENLLDRFVDILHATGLPEPYLHLEITENIMLQPEQHVLRLLRQFRERHLRLYMDDFGAGYSSLGYLHQLPIDGLKIDRSFVSNLRPDNRNQEIIRTILRLAEEFNLDVVAEGVETDRQLEVLLQLGCPHAQGHFFSPPVPAEAAYQLLQREFIPTKTIEPT